LLVLIANWVTSIVRARKLRSFDPWKGGQRLVIEAFSRHPLTNEPIVGWGHNWNECPEEIEVVEYIAALFLRFYQGKAP
jgi:hypothetical protein